MGGLDKAIEMVKKKASIGVDENVRLVPYPGKRTIFEQLLRQSADTAMETKLKTMLGGLDYKLWMKGGIMRVMPYSINIQ